MQFVCDLFSFLLNVFFLFTGLCPDWDEWNPNNAYDNADKAMDLAQTYLDVPKVTSSFCNLL